MTKVAFIGLGRMGHGMAGRYLDAGFSVAVWNRSKGGRLDHARRAGRHLRRTPLTTQMPS
jgi:3-hydroxyisobutyrate dehydrogenase